MDWFLYDRDLHYERVKTLTIFEEKLCMCFEEKLYVFNKVLNMPLTSLILTTTVKIVSTTEYFFEIFQFFLYSYLLCKSSC